MTGRSALDRSWYLAAPCFVVFAAAATIAAVLFTADYRKAGAAVIGVAVTAALGGIWFALAPEDGT